ncbi:hypothetical protein [Nocardia sp. NPDC005998]|uniref:hypothetical protein n=1 Tax=Nocardia sp. NPDC005998 TaxID=3156894 RepID=UPI0033A00D1A
MKQQVAAMLPERLGDAVLLAARTAFLDGVHVTATIAGLAALALSVIAVPRLRRIPAGAFSNQS